MIDVFDGLFVDLWYIVEVFGVCIDLFVVVLVVDCDVLIVVVIVLGIDFWLWVLSGGEDYVLVVCFVGLVLVGWCIIGWVFDGLVRVLVDGEEWIGYVGW